MTNIKRAGLLGIEDLDRGEIEAILDRARYFQPLPNETYRRLDTLKGKTIVNLFFEASTRTRVSFEIAARRLCCADRRPCCRVSWKRWRRACGWPGA